MTEDYPTPAGPPVPPPEELSDWLQQACKYSPHDFSPAMIGGFMARKAAAWGADQELEACCEWMANRYGDDSHAMSLLRAARRPNLKQQALAAVATSGIGANHAAIIRRALEALPD